MSSPAARAFVAVRAALAAALFAALWVWLAALVRRYDAALGGPLPAGLAPFGWLLVALGVALAASCVTLFVTRGRGTPAPFDPPREFVASGPYRWVRNPMYLGAILVLAGGGLVVGSAAIALLAGGFWLLAHAFVLFYEEPALAARFGDSYALYKQGVARWRVRRPTRP